jgi:hypothetical protein
MTKFLFKVIEACVNCPYEKTEYDRLNGIAYPGRWTMICKKYRPQGDDTNIIAVSRYEAEDNQRLRDRDGKAIEVGLADLPIPEWCPLNDLMVFQGHNVLSVGPAIEFDAKGNRKRPSAGTRTIPVSKGPREPNTSLDHRYPDFTIRLPESYASPSDAKDVTEDEEDD